MITNTQMPDLSAKSVPLKTLGAKEKHFTWLIDVDQNLLISRKFVSDKHPRATKVSANHLDLIFDYMKSNEWVDLANSVTKLDAGTEKEGLGFFLHNKLTRNTRMPNWQVSWQPFL